MPDRIQRCRTPGWRMPANTVYVGRPTMWGNPFRVGTRRDPLPPLTAHQAMVLFEQWLTTTVSQPSHGVQRAHLLRELHQLRGRNLACWCAPGEPCHADVLLRLANPDPAGGDGW